MSNELLSSKTVIQEAEPTTRRIPGVATAILALVGVTERGPVGEVVRCTSRSEYRKVFGGYVTAGDIAQAIDGYFSNGGQTVDVVRTVHYTDPTVASSKTSAAASLVLSTAALAATAGAVTGTGTFPLALVPGDTLVVTTDAGGPSTATFNAASASRESSAGPFALTNGMQLTYSVNGVPQTPITFVTANFVNIAAATVAEVAAAIAAASSGIQVLLTSGDTKVTMRTDKQGSGQTLNITGGTANAQLLFTTGATSGTGNVADIGAVTSAEAKSIIEGAVAGVTFDLVGANPRIRSNTLGGSSSVLVGASSTADDEFGFDNATHTGNAAATLNAATVNGKTDGTYANALTVKIANASNGESARFNLQVIKAGVILETWVNLSMDDADASFIETVINDDALGSNYIKITDADAATSAANQRPANGTFGPLSGGNDGLVGLVDADFIGNVGTGSNRTGIRALDVTPDITLLAVPGQATAAIHLAMVAYCETERAGAVFAVLDPPQGSTAQGIVTYVDVTAGLSELTEYAAIYWPRVKVANPDRTVFGSAAQLTVAPSGYVAGVMARTDSARDGGVYDAPAGVEKGVLNNVLGFETDECLDERKRDLVYPKRINPLTTGRGQPRFIDGSRTLKGKGNFPSVSERRGVIFIEQSIKDGIQYARHKNNDEALRASLDRTVDSFLGVQMKNGAFRTKVKSTAYSVDFGEALNPPAAVFANRVYGNISLATQKPAEFIILTFAQDTRAFDQAGLGKDQDHGHEGRSAELRQEVQVHHRVQRHRVRRVRNVLEAGGGDRHRGAQRGRARSRAQEPRSREGQRPHAGSRRLERQGPLPLVQVGDRHGLGHGPGGRRLQAGPRHRRAQPREQAQVSLALLPVLAGQVRCGRLGQQERRRPHGRDHHRHRVLRPHRRGVNGGSLSWRGLHPRVRRETMALKEVLCPSGLRIAVRGMKIKEANALADNQAIRRGTGMDTLLDSCVVDILDRGPYPADTVGERAVWSKILVGDRFGALMGIRVQTYGPEYAFRVQCTEARCGETFDWTVDLEKDLAWKAYDPLALQSFFANKTFPFELPDGKAAELRFLVGEDERAMSKTRKDKQLSTALASRIVTITAPNFHANDRVRYIEDLDLSEAREIIAKLDDYDGGIETEVRVACTECGREQDVQLPFDKGFWMPEKSKAAQSTP